MQARMTNPAVLLPDVMKSLYTLSRTAANLGVPESTLHMVHLRASQINGCSVCVDMHGKDMRKVGETDERIFAVAAWRDTPYYTEAERAALELTEALTRTSDRPDPVPDEIWAQAAKHYDERGLAALLIAIGTINMWNRFNIATRQVAGAWTK